jgi:hypothetical protein
MADNADISDDDITRESDPTEDVENLDIGRVENRDRGDESDGPIDGDEDVDGTGIGSGGVESSE